MSNGWPADRCHARGNIDGVTPDVELILVATNDRSWLGAGRRGIRRSVRADPEGCGRLGYGIDVFLAERGEAAGDAQLHHPDAGCVPVAQERRDWQTSDEDLAHQLLSDSSFQGGARRHFDFRRILQGIAHS